MKCNGPDCTEPPTVRLLVLQDRRCSQTYEFCHDHCMDFLSQRTDPLSSTFDLQSAADVERLTVDVEFMTYEVKSATATVYLGTQHNQALFGITIGPVESALFYNEVSGRKADRPMTHQTMAKIIQSLGAQVQYVLIDEWHELNGAFHAKLALKHDQHERIIDLRPSDAFILSLVSRVPILVDKAVVLALRQSDTQES